MCAALCIIAKVCVRCNFACHFDSSTLSPAVGSSGFNIRPILALIYMLEMKGLIASYVFATSFCFFLHCVTHFYHCILRYQIVEIYLLDRIFVFIE